MDIKGGEKMGSWKKKQAKIKIGLTKWVVVIILYGFFMYLITMITGTTEALSNIPHIYIKIHAGLWMVFGVLASEATKKFLGTDLE